MRRAAFLAGLAALMLMACDPAAPAGDDSRRIVVVGSNIAEIVVALGAAEEVVGVSGGTDHITELSGVPRLAGFRQSSAESILSLQPTLVMLSAEVSTPGVAEQLQAAGVRVERFAEDPTLPGVEQRITQVATALGAPQAAPPLIASFRADLANAQALVARTVTRPRVIFILSGGGRPTLIGGTGTGVANLIELAGAENGAAGVQGFRVMSQEAMVAAAPEYFLVNPEGMTGGDGGPVALTAPGARLTPAGRNARIIAMPGQYLQGFGLLTPEAIRRLARAVHPELAGGDDGETP